MHRSLSLAALLAALALTACGPTSYVVQGQQPFIGADGTVEIDQDGGAYVVEVEVRNLVPPDRVSAGLTQYVVWFVPNGGTPVRAANLVYDPTDREGTARATSPDARLTVVVTAEAEGTPTTPSTSVVFSQAVDAR